MERGDVWTCLYEGYASKPRPVLIVQDNAVFRQFGSMGNSVKKQWLPDREPLRIFGGEGGIRTLETRYI